ncbi:MAG: hypothetical protein KC729_10465 [Candidatus Eisenbacteria bacterium]|uniref:GAF domain-containing protein n=1 Tax=Eiseniibacteriota bacterium TaxID=2212470 RepID=A0A956RP14_UNCEI|nr:hypothetical protein [Candidatus Eisenbacteria bacterium]
MIAMGIDLWLISAALCSLTALIVVGVATVRSGPPPGRGALAAFLLACAVDWAWLGAQHSDYRFWNPGAMAMGDVVAAIASVALAPLGVLLAIRFGQSASLGRHSGLPALLLAALAAPVLLFVGLRSEEAVFLLNEGGDILLALQAGPARAVAVLVLVTSCYGLMRLFGVAVLARRRGLSQLARAAFALGAGLAGLFLVASQLLLYGALSLRLITFGSLTSVPLLATCLPALGSRHPGKEALPASVKPTGSMLLLLGLGLFLIALAGIGQVVHQTMPEHGLLWFRWGGAVLVVLAAVVGAVPAVRRPLTAYFDPDHGGTSWDFRREWARANAALGPARTREELVQRLRTHLESIFGPTGIAFWWAPNTQSRAEACGTGNVVLPSLEPENPLYRRAARGDEVLELVHPTQRLEELPLVVENHELIERFGFRVFSSTRIGEGVGILGIAPPPEVRFEQDQCALIANLTGMVATYFPLLERAGANTVARDDVLER